MVQYGTGNAPSRFTPMSHSIAFLIYDGVAFADFSRPYDTLNSTADLTLHTVGRTKEIVTFDSGLQRLPDHIYPDAHIYQAIIVPGGPGWQEAAANLRLLQWLGRAARLANVIAAIGDGVRLLAAAGVLKGQTAAGQSTWSDTYPAVTFLPDQPLVHSGKYITAASAESGNKLGQAVRDCLAQFT
jgi:cyclohexyl-isocyanide hydratase